MARSKNDRQIDYVELVVDDIAKMKAFYGTVFGWEFTDYGPDYCEFRDGRLSGGFAKGKPTPGGPLVVLYGDDLPALVEAVRKAGGKIAKPIFSCAQRNSRSRITSGCSSARGTILCKRRLPTRQSMTASARCKRHSDSSATPTGIERYSSRASSKAPWDRIPRRSRISVAALEAAKYASCLAGSRHDVALLASRIPRSSLDRSTQYFLVQKLPISSPSSVIQPRPSPS